MKSDLLKYIKVINGIYFISILIWMIFWFLPLEYFNLRTLVIVALSLFSTQIMVLLCSLIFYFFTKNILLIKDQIQYGLIIMMAVIDILYLINPNMSDGSILIFFFCMNFLSVSYILKNKLTQKKSPVKIQGFFTNVGFVLEILIIFLVIIPHQLRE